jgi:hypothetical protein
VLSAASFLNVYCVMVGSGARDVKCQATSMYLRSSAGRIALSSQRVLTALGDDYVIMRLIDVTEVTLSPFVFIPPINNSTNTQVVVITRNNHSNIYFVNFEVII